MANCQPDVAVLFYVKAHEADPSNEDTMDLLADCYLQMGDPENAVPVLERSIAMAPEGSPYKYLYIAQLQQGQDALLSFEKAVILLTRDYASAGSTDASMDTAANDTDERGSVVNLQRQLAKAYCSAAELFLTDLCDEDGAEQRCEDLLKSAAVVDGQSLDVLQTLASLRCSQCRSADAGEIMATVSNRVCAALEAAQQQTIMGAVSEQQKASAETSVFGGATAAANVTAEDCPDLSFCVQTAKLLVECAPSNPMLAESAMDLCQLLLEEDDEDVEVWYIMGVAALGACPPNTDAAQYHLEHARDMILTHQERYGADEGRTVQLGLIEQRLVETTAALAELEIAAEGEQDEEVEM